MYHRIARFLGLLVGGILGWEAAYWVPGIPQTWTDPAFLRWAIPFGAAGALLGYVTLPAITVRPAIAAANWLRMLPLAQLLAGTVGMMLGLLMSAVLAIPLSRLPAPFGQILPMVGVIVFAYMGTVGLVLRYQDILEMWRGRGLRIREREHGWGPTPVLVDTSVIIDGRIADIVHTGFLRGPLLVPRFILNELQYIADADDPIRRNRGRRGLEILHELQEGSDVELRVLEEDVRETRQVDEKLIRLAKRLGCPILTNDYNLNRIATLQGVDVLNINELANAVKTILLPGETFEIHVLQEGKEPDQGVGYLDDGTMVVVQEGKPYIGRTIEVTVTKVLQTSAGRMIFAVPTKKNESRSVHTDVKAR